MNKNAIMKIDTTTVPGRLNEVFFISLLSQKEPVGAIRKRPDGRAIPPRVMRVLIIGKNLNSLDFSTKSAALIIYPNPRLTPALGQGKKACFGAPRRARTREKVSRQWGIDGYFSMALGSLHTMV
jgi:hypothetical protein